MSTLVIVRKGATATIASDSLFCQGSIKVSPSNRRNHHKIHEFQGAFIGLTGWSVFHNIFEEIIEKFPGSIDLRSRKHIFQTFQRLHHILKEDYHIFSAGGKDDPLESSRWDCLIASPFGIFGVGTLREVEEYDRYWADGSGLRFALGAAEATYDLLPTSEEIARTAVASACELDDGSAPPVYAHTVTLLPPN